MENVKRDRDRVVAVTPGSDCVRTSYDGDSAAHTEYYGDVHLPAGRSGTAFQVDRHAV